MKNRSNAKADFNQESDKLDKEIQPDLNGLKKRKIMNYDDTEKDLNSQILKITMTIKDQYPELSKYLEEMPGTIPDENSPEVTLKNLKSYLDSLNSMLKNYKFTHLHKSK